MVEIGENDKVTVIFDSYSEECVTVPLEDVFPIGEKSYLKLQCSPFIFDFYICRTV